MWKNLISRYVASMGACAFIGDRNIKQMGGTLEVQSASTEVMKQLISNLRCFTLLIFRYQEKSLVMHFNIVDSGLFCTFQRFPIS